MARDPEPATRESQPTLEEKLELGILILKYLARRNSKKRRPVVTFLFKEIERMGMHPQPICAAEIVKALPGIVTNEQNARQMASRLKKDCAHFFDKSEEGRRQKWCVYFTDGDYLPRFKINSPSPKEEDFFTAFWFVHRDSMNPTRLVYPEPQFFIDKGDTYLRRPRAYGIQDKKQFDYLYPDDWDHLRTAYSYVPSGIVGAMLRIIACFHSFGRDILVTPLRPGPDDLVPDTRDNLIVLGTPTSTRVTTILEEGLPIRAHPEHITRAEDRPVDEGGSEYAENDAPLSPKWGVLTRRRHRYDDRVVTLLTARHGRTVDAMAQFITSAADMSHLGEKLHKPMLCPDWFQALFRVLMIPSQRGPQIDRTIIDDARIVNDPGSAAFGSGSH